MKEYGFGGYWEKVLKYALILFKLDNVYLKFIFRSKEVFDR